MARNVNSVLGQNLIARNVSKEKKQKVVLFPEVKVHVEMIGPLWPRFIDQLLVNPKRRMIAQIKMLQAQ